MDLKGTPCDKRKLRGYQNVRHRKFSVDESLLKDLKAKYSVGGSPMCEGKTRRGRTPSVGHTHRRLSECKVFYQRNSSRDSTEDSCSTCGKETRTNSITKLGSQITAIIGITPQVSDCLHFLILRSVCVCSEAKTSHLLNTTGCFIRKVKMFELCTRARIQAVSWERSTFSIKDVNILK